MSTFGQGTSIYSAGTFFIEVGAGTTAEPVVTVPAGCYALLTIHRWLCSAAMVIFDTRFGGTNPSVYYTAGAADQYAPLNEVVLGENASLSLNTASINRSVHISWVIFKNT